MTKKCIVITTINNPSEQILYYSSLAGWVLIIVGDSKTDNSAYSNINCVYIGLEEQKRMFPTLYDKIPLKSYTRKIFGYLYAIKNNFAVIYDTDDDNQYIGDINKFQTDRPFKYCNDIGFTNTYKIFTDSHIWPRGIPPNHKSIIQQPQITDTPSNLECAIIQGLVNNDPDVDAHYRINNSDKPFTFERDDGYDVMLNRGAVCPFNTQNTFWIIPELFYALYLPVSVTFRYTDILRGFVALFQLWRHNKTIKITIPSAFQKRNAHDLTKDYESEIPMYNTAEKVISLLENNVNATIIDVYKILADNNIVSYTEIDVLQEWLDLIERRE
jgi:hypothetical protein